MADNKNVKDILALLDSKLDRYDKKLDSIQTKIDDIAVIKHQIESFTKQITELQSDVKSFKDDYQDFKGIEYKVQQLLDWKQQVQDILTTTDMSNLKTDNQSLKLQMNEISQKLINLKEEITKSLTNKTVVSGGISAVSFTAVIQAILHYYNSVPK